MAQLRAILQRKKAAQGIGKITRAMALVAGAKLRKQRTRLRATTLYAQQLREIATTVAGATDSPPRLIRSPGAGNAAGRCTLLVITSNRGLVGAYNSNVLRLASDFIRAREAEHTLVEVHVVGRKGAAFFAAHGRSLARYEQAGDAPTLSDVEALGAQLVSRVLAGQIDSVHVAYTVFVSAGVQRPQLLTLLPMAALLDPVACLRQPATAPDRTGAAIMYDFTPEPGVLLNKLLPLVLQASLLECFLNAATSESAARKLTTLRATDNADQMFRRLKLQYNRARQDHITNELMIIVGAAEAIRTSSST